MTKQEILSQMMRTEHHAIETDLYSLCAIFAEQLATVMDRLDEAEIQRFIEIGASMHRSGRAQFGAEVPVEDLFPSRKSWSLGPKPGRSGYRKER
ncbi:MAG: hypothetical protein JWM30_1979 [Burkholderia sp.]|jgi:hypothetical protein|nr:hypothetical protein [Burkholderia sp.]